MNGLLSSWKRFLKNNDIYRQNLNGISVWALAFGCVIGWGSFVMPGTTFLPDSGPLGTTIGIVISALIVLFACANYSYLMSRNPVPGGSYTFTRGVLGEDHAFLAAWALEIAYISLLWANATAVILLFRYIFGDALQWGFLYRFAGYDVYLGEVFVTILILIVFGTIDCFWKKITNIIRVLFGITMFASVVVLFVAILAKTGASHMFTPRFSTGESAGMQILNIVVLAPWLFVGFETVTHSVEDIHFPVRRMFLYAGLAIVTGMLVYIFLNLTAAAAVPAGYADWAEYMADLKNLSGYKGLPVLHNAHAILGQWGVVLVVIAAGSTLTTSIFGFHRAASRVVKTMADGRLLPAMFAKVNRAGVPVNADILVVLLSLPIPLLGRTAIGWNVDVSTLSVSIVYVYISICCIMTSEGNRRVLINGICGAVSFILIFFFLLMPNMFAKNALALESYLIFAGWSLVGILYYGVVFWKDKEHRFGKSTIMWIMMLFLLFFSTNIWTRLSVHNRNLSSFIQLTVSMAVIAIMYSLFAIMRRRERELTQEIIQTEVRVRTQEQERQSMEIIRRFSRSFESVLVVSLIDDSLTILKMEEPVRRKYGNGTSFSATVAKYINNDVASEDRELLLTETKFDRISERLSKSDSYSVEFRDISRGEPRWHLLQVSILSENNTILVGFSDKDGEIRERMERQAVIHGLASDYSLVCFINVKTGKDKIYSISDKQFTDFPEWSNITSFRQRLDIICNTMVHPEDRHMFLSATAKDYVLEQLKSRGDYYVNYRMLQQNKIKYWQIRFVAADKECRNIICGFHSVDEAVRHEADMIQKERAYRNAILSSSIGFMDINLTKNLMLDAYDARQSMQIKPIEFPDLPKPHKFTDFITWWAENMIYSDKETFINTVSPAKLIDQFNAGNPYVEFRCMSRFLSPEQRVVRIVYFMTRNETSGDIMALSIIYDITEAEARGRRIEELTAELQEFRVRNSVSQLQPHFLYNSLSSIREMILEDPDYASELLYDFTMHLKACIKSMSEGSLIPFDQEITNVKAFVALEKMRMGDKLAIEYDLKETDFQVVPLGVQLFVENAVRHGIFFRGKTGGKITIQSDKDKDGNFVVKIMDTGIGFDSQKVLAEIDRGEKDAAGIKNLTFQFKRLLNADVSVESQVGAGTVVTITIPPAAV